MRYEEPVFRPPSEADSYILQATIGCSWNACTYCDMYRSKRYRVRELEETLADIELARLLYGGAIDKVFVADGDALGMDLARWERVLSACKTAFPRLRRVSSYATATICSKSRRGEISAARAGLSFCTSDPSPAITPPRSASRKEPPSTITRDAPATPGSLSTISPAWRRRAYHEHAIGSARLHRDGPAIRVPSDPDGDPDDPDAKPAGGRFTLPAIGELASAAIFVAEAMPTRCDLQDEPRVELPAARGRLPRDAVEHRFSMRP
jgi:hypothetical protein